MTWSSATTPVSHPADGQIGCNNADPSNCTQIWASFKGTNGADCSGLFNTFSHENGGYLVIRDVADGSPPENIFVYPLSKFGYSFSSVDLNQMMNCSPATIYLGGFFNDGDPVIVTFLPPPVPPAGP